MTHQSTASSIVAALIAGVTIYGLAMGTTYPLLGIALADQVTGLWNGINAAATGIGLLVGVVVVPSCSRRLGSGATALAGVVLMAASLAMLTVAGEFWAMLAARLLLGCGANMLFVVAETALNVFAAPAWRGRVMGIYTAAVAFGFVVGPAIVAAIPNRPSLLLLACAAVTAFAVMPVRLARVPVDRFVRPSSITRLLPAVLAFPFAFGFLVVASAIDAVAISLLPVVTRDQSYSIEAGALFVAIFHIGLLVGQPLVGTLLDTVGRRWTVLGCCLACLGCTAALVFGDRLGFWPTAILMLTWGGGNFGLYTASLALIGDRFLGESLSAATAAFAAVYAIAAVASPILAGATMDSVGAIGFYLATASIYLTALICGAACFRPLEPTLSTR